MTPHELAADIMSDRFRLGGLDCVSGALRVSDALLGNDAAVRLDTLYQGRKGALQTRHEHGSTNRAVAALARSLGFSALSDGMYEIGDVAMVQGQSLGVWLGDMWAAKTAKGVAYCNDAPGVHYRPTG